MDNVFNLSGERDNPPAGDAIMIMPFLIAVLHLGSAGFQGGASPQGLARQAPRPDLSAALEAAQRDLRERWAGRPASGREGVVVIECASADRGVDSELSGIAARELAALLRKRGARVQLAARADEGGVRGRGALELVVAVLGVENARRLRIRERPDVGDGVPERFWAFAEKEWVRGSSPRAAGGALSFKVMALESSLEEARRRARELALAKLRDLLVSARQVSSAHLLEHLAEWEWDRFEGVGGDPLARGIPTCAVLYRLNSTQLAALRGAAHQHEQERLSAGIARGALGLLLLVGCVLGYLHMDLRTRGYLSGTWKLVFALLFGSGMALILLVG